MTKHARTEDPKGGMGAKKRGSPAQGRGTDTLAIDTPGIPYISASGDPSQDVLPHSNGSLLPKIPSPARGSLEVNDPAVASGEMSPSARWAGKDPKTGKVIEHRRSEKVARQVATYAANGLGDNDIACLLNIRPGQLRHYYYRELHNGGAEVEMKIASAMVDRAVDPEGGAVAQRASEFWLQARRKWRTGDEKGQGDQSILAIAIHL